MSELYCNFTIIAFAKATGKIPDSGFGSMLACWLGSKHIVTTAAIGYLRNIVSHDVAHSTLEESMRRLRILPGAAGIIALTATIGFVDGQRNIEVDGFSRGKITLVSPHSLIATDASAAVGKAGINTGNPAYQVEVIRGDTFSTVMIDAVTGRILLS